MIVRFHCFISTTITVHIRQKQKQKSLQWLLLSIFLLLQFCSILLIDFASTTTSTTNTNIFFALVNGFTTISRSVPNKSFLLSSTFVKSNRVIMIRNNKKNHMNLANNHVKDEVFAVSAGAKEDANDSIAIDSNKKRVTQLDVEEDHNRKQQQTPKMNQRRVFIQQTTSTILSSLGWATMIGGSSSFLYPDPVYASIDNKPVITDKIYIDIKGLPDDTGATGGPASSGSSSSTGFKRIVIGLYGKEAPNCVQKIKSLMTSSTGLPALCKPKVERVLQKEQLEANKVYNRCMDNENMGVTLLYSTIWRIIPNERIDIGAVAGKFVAREYPNWYEKENENNNESNSFLKHNQPGVVSVRKGTSSGFGFTIYPGNNNSKQQQQGNTNTNVELDEENIIIGQVIEGLDIIEQLNTKVPIITTSNVNYMGLTGGGSRGTSAPDRSCRYGGPMYCNENKPLIKLTIQGTGIL